MFFNNTPKNLLLAIALSFIFFNAAYTQNTRLYKAEIPTGFKVGIKMRYSGPQPETSRPYESMGKLQFTSFYLTAFDGTKITDDKDKLLKCWRQETEPSNAGTYSLQNNGLAAINIGLWGCTLLSDYATELTARPSVNANYLVKDLITDVMEQSGGQLIQISEGHEYKLLVFDLAAQPIVKGVFKELITNLHSDQVYLIWDFTTISTLPPGFIDARYESFPLKLKEFKVATVYFEPSIGWLKTKLTLTPKSGTGSPQNVPSGKSLSLNNRYFNRLLIKKPAGFNIVSTGMNDTIDWRKEYFEYSTSGRTGEDTLRLIPITYSVIYIDATRSNYMAINQSIDTIIQKNPGLFYVYLAWKNKPVIATKTQELVILKGKIYDLAFETARYDFDKGKIALTLAPILKSYSNRLIVNLHLFLPWENSVDETIKFISRFSEKDMLYNQKVKSNLYIFGVDLQNIEKNKIPSTKIHILKEQ